MQSTQILLAARPDGEPTADDFETVTVDLPPLEDGQVLLRVRYLSLDPYMRGRMSDGRVVRRPGRLGEVMVGATVCEVVESRSPHRAVGDQVLSYSGWQTHAVADARHTRRLDPDAAPVSTALGVLGMPGFTAYAGLLQLGKPQPGETVVVAAATGPVGSAVGQIARIKGARAVGIAGGPEKCRALLEEFGFDAAVDHRAADFRDRLAEAVPDGIDVYFENVGGAVARAVLRHLNLLRADPGVRPGRGLQRDRGARGAGPAGRVHAQGAHQEPDRPRLHPERVREEHHAQFLEEMSGWVREGRVRYREDVTVGLENVVEAFTGMLAGRNFGKVLIQVGD